MRSNFVKLLASIIKHLAIFDINYDSALNATTITCKAGDVTSAYGLIANAIHKNIFGNSGNNASKLKAILSVKGSMLFI